MTSSRRRRHRPLRPVQRTPFQKLMDGLFEKHGAAQPIAEELDISLSALLRGVQVGTLSTENCLRLAEAYALRPSEVLQVAGKGEIATLIEGLYGKPIPTTILASDRRRLDRWRALDAADQHILDRLLVALGNGQ